MWRFIMTNRIWFILGAVVLSLVAWFSGSPEKDEKTIPEGVDVEVVRQQQPAGDAAQGNAGAPTRLDRPRETSSVRSER